MPYTLAYKDRYMRVEESKIESDTTGSVAFASLPDNEPTRLITEWTGRQFTKLVSAVKTGAELMFPDEANEIIWQLIKVVHQPIGFDTEEGDCFNYLPSAPFVSFAPQNPYNQPDYIPDDYLVPPFFVNSEFAYPSEFGYLATDVFIDGASINIDPIDLLTLNLPQIKITVFGSGQIELDLLAVTLGSQVVIKVGGPPNIFDIVIDGFLEDVTIIDLNVDSLSVPPETDILYSEEINIEAAAGIPTDVYIVFIPNLDDSLIPLRYGGGIRQIGLCGFETAGTIMGIEDVQFNTATCTFEKRVSGVWETMVGGDEWLDCVPTGGGGGGGASGIVAKVYKLGTAGTGGIGTTSTTFVDMTGLTFNHTPNKANMLVLMNNILVANTTQANQPLTVRILADGNVGLDAIEQVHTNSAVDPLSVSDRWLVTPDVSIEIKLQWKVGGGNGGWSQRQTINVTILEFDDEVTGDFVENVRIEGRELQQQKSGAWETVTDSLDAILGSIDSQITTINATNTTQQTQINTATTTNATQNGRLNVVEANITAIQAIQTAHGLRLDDIDLSIAGLVIEQAEQNGRLDDLEEATGGTTSLGAWGGYRLRAITDINTNGGKYSSTENTWDEGTFPFIFVGWEPDLFGQVEVDVENAAKFNSMQFLRVGIQVATYVGGSEFFVRVNGGEWANIRQNSAGQWIGWVKIQNIQNFDDPNNFDLKIEVRSNDVGNDWRFKSAVWAYINVNPFDGTTSD